VLAVDDNGAGVPAEELPGLFDRFRRGRNAGAAGSGLGLSIVAEIAQMFDGAVELAAPSGGKGFHVVVRLPLADRQNPRLPQAAGEA
jgi:signal transduction histidine kinase